MRRFRLQGGAGARVNEVCVCVRVPVSVSAAVVVLLCAVCAEVCPGGLRSARVRSPLLR